MGIRPSKSRLYGNNIEFNYGFNSLEYALRSDQRDITVPVTGISNPIFTGDLDQGEETLGGNSGFGSLLFSGELDQGEVTDVGLGSSVFIADGGGFTVPKDSDLEAIIPPETRGGM